jgi:nucleotide-binding universal stress UspA family protein
MLDPILVPLDGSLLAECVLPHVVAIARAFNAKVVLLRVLGQNQALESAQSCDPLNWQIDKTEARVYLERIGAQLQEVGVQTQIAVWEGLVAEWITEFARTKGMKLIILSTHGRSGLSQWGISSVVQKIILSAPTSLLIVRARQPIVSELTEQPYTRLLVPLDGSRRAEYALPMITLLARVHKSQVHLVHVVKKPEMARQMPPTQEDTDLSNRIVARNQEEAAHYLDQLQLRSPLEGIAVQTHLLISDNTAAALHEFVEREHIDMVTLSAHGYSGNTQWPYGSVVNNLMSYSKVPLLVVQDLPAKKENHTAADVAAREPVGH